MLDRDQQLDRARRLLAAADGWHPANRQTFELALAYNWRIFINNHGGGNEFLLRPSKLQEDLLRHMNDRCEHYFQLATVEKHFASNAMCFSFFLIAFYLQSLIDQDSEIESELAPKLDKHLKKGWPRSLSFEIPPSTYSDLATRSVPILFERNYWEQDVD